MLTYLSNTLIKLGEKVGVSVPTSAERPSNRELTVVDTKNSDELSVVKTQLALRDVYLPFEVESLKVLYKKGSLLSTMEGTPVTDLEIRELEFVSKMFGKTTSSEDVRSDSSNIIPVDGYPIWNIPEELKKIQNVVKFFDNSLEKEYEKLSEQLFKENFDKIWVISSAEEFRSYGAECFKRLLDFLSANKVRQVYTEKPELGDEEYAYFIEYDENTGEISNVKFFYGECSIKNFSMEPEKSFSKKLDVLRKLGWSYEIYKNCEEDIKTLQEKCYDMNSTLEAITKFNEKWKPYTVKAEVVYDKTFLRKVNIKDEHGVITSSFDTKSWGMCIGMVTPALK